MSRIKRSLLNTCHKIDEIVKIRFSVFSVIPAKAGYVVKR